MSVRRATVVAALRCAADLCTDDDSVYVPTRGWEINLAFEAFEIDYGRACQYAEENTGIMLFFGPYEEKRQRLLEAAQLLEDGEVRLPDPETVS